jgi:hypothetical protein
VAEAKLMTPKAGGEPSSPSNDACGVDVDG